MQKSIFFYIKKVSNKLKYRNSEENTEIANEYQIQVKFGVNCDKSLRKYFN